MNGYDWSRLAITFFYPAPTEAVYRRWATGEGLESFFVAQARFTTEAGEPRASNDPAQAGDTYSWTWRHGFSLTGHVRGADRAESIEFTFGEMVVRVRFRAVDPSTTEVCLEQWNIADDVMGHLNCRSCWVFYMTNLKSLLTAGTDLRDDDPSRVSSMEVGYRMIEAG